MICVVFLNKLFTQKQGRRKKLKSPVFALFGVCSALFGAVRIISMLKWSKRRKNTS